MKEAIRKMALETGYILAGFSDVMLKDRDLKNLTLFAESLGDEMSWFQKYKELRGHPEKFMSDARSVLMLAVPYRDNEYDSFVSNSAYKISRYAAGKDYHKILRKKGKRLLEKIQIEFPGIKGRITVDSAPVPEKIFGLYSGIGWRGKHTNLIHPDYGSYFFLSALFLNAKLTSDEPMKDRCGSCRKCIEACPTKAITDYKIDAAKCISYLTIEKNGAISDEFSEKLKGWIFGCDICQEVCPYNQRERSRAVPPDESIRVKKEIIDLLKYLNAGAVIQTGNVSGELFKMISGILDEGTPLRRAGIEKILGNIRTAIANT